MSELHTVSSFTFYQENGEVAVEVSYYHGSIQLKQEDRWLMLDNDSYEKLFKDIKKHFGRANEALNGK